jgi:hypothetical protein
MQGYFLSLYFQKDYQFYCTTGELHKFNKKSFSFLLVWSNRADMIDGSD